MRILYPDSPSPDNLINPLTPEQPKQIKQPPTDTSVIGALLGIDAVKQFRASAPATENSQEPKEDLPGGELALTAEEVAQAKAREQEQTPEHQARAWLLGLGKDENWIEEHFNFKDGITCIASELNLSNCNIAELPSFFKEIRKITHLNLTKNLLTTLKNIPKEIEGDLFPFDNPKLASLTGLEGVHVGRDLFLSNNPSLTSCTGLEGIHVGGGLFLFDNPKLASLTGLEGVHVGGDLFLSSNPSLTSCTGLEGIHVGGDLYLDKNPSLTSLAGLEGVTVEKDLYLNDNTSLTSLVGLEGVHVKGNINLSNNPSLASLEGLPPKENIGGCLIFSQDQEHLIQEAREKGYNVRIN